MKKIIKSSRRLLKISSNFLKTLDEISGLDKNLEEFELNQIGAEKFKRDELIRKLNSSLEQILNMSNSYNSIKSLSSNLNIQTKEELHDISIITKKIKHDKISGLTDLDLNQIYSIIEDLKVKLTENTVKYRTQIKNKGKILKSKLEKTFNLIENFSKIPGLQEQITKKFVEIFKHQNKDDKYEKYIRTLTSHLENNPEKELKNKSSSDLSDYNNISSFLESINNMLDFSSIKDQYGLTQEGIHIIELTLSKKENELISIKEIKLEGFTNLKEKMPDFYNRICFKLK